MQDIIDLLIFLGYEKFQIPEYNCVSDGYKYHVENNINLIKFIDNYTHIRCLFKNENTCFYKITECDFLGTMNKLHPIEIRNLKIDAIKDKWKNYMKKDNMNN